MTMYVAWWWWMDRETDRSPVDRDIFFWLFFLPFFPSTFYVVSKHGVARVEAANGEAGWRLSLQINRLTNFFHKSLFRLEGGLTPKPLPILFFLFSSFCKYICMCGDMYPSLTAVIIRASQENHANSSSRCLILHTLRPLFPIRELCVSFYRSSLSLSRLVLSWLPPSIALLSLRSNNSSWCALWSSSIWWLTSLRSNSSHHVSYHRLSDLTSLRSSYIKFLTSKFSETKFACPTPHVWREFIRTWWCTITYPPCLYIWLERSEESENDCWTLE